MDFLDSLKDIKRQMQDHCCGKIKNSNNAPKLKTQAKQESSHKHMEEIFLKQERLQGAFLEFIKDTDIKKI